MGYQGYNESGLVNIPDNKIGTQMLDKLSRVKSDRRQKPLDQMDNIRYSHRAMYDGFNLLIGDTYFMIPPEFIMVNSEATSQSIVTLRQENTQKEKSGYHKRIILIDLVFNGIEQLNGYKVKAPHIVKKNDDGTVIYDNEGYYYVDGLRQLLAQFKCTPILPITNELINGMYGIFTVALQSITMSTVDGFPNTMTAQITLQEVCMFPYIEMPDICFKYMIDWDLFRYYYQTFLTENHVYKRLQSLPANHEHNRFRMSILDNSIFALDSDETGVDEYNILDVVCDKTILRKNENGDKANTNYITWIDSNESDCVISSFQCGYSNLLTNIQLSDMSSPTVQFMGGMDTIYNITFETTDYSVVQALEQCQIANDMITRNNGKIRSSVGFVKLESELVEFTGSLFVMIESIATNTVPGFPGLYNVQMNCVSYDIAQSEREDLNGFLPFDCTKNGRCGEFDSKTKEYVSDHKHDEQAIPNSKAGLWNKIQQDNYAEWKLRTTMEVYPDLRLPKYKEVDEAIKAIKSFRSANGLSALPYNKYPVQPMGIIHGCNLDKNISASYSDSEQAIIFPKDIDKSSLEYNVYVDPDFYVFYPASYVSFGDEDAEYYDSVLTPPQREGYTKTKIKYQHPNYNATSNSSGNGNIIEDFIALAQTFIGHTYVWGAEGEVSDSKGKCFDCSGFVTYLLKEIGVMPASQDRFTVKTMPGSSLFEKVAWSDMKRGDILCNSGLTHVVIYEGNNQVIHAANKSPYPKGGVKESNLYFSGGTCLRVKAFYDGSSNTSASPATNTSGFYATDEFLKMVEEWEGFLGKATAKDGGIDIGFGFHNTYFDGTKNVKIKYGMTMTREQAEKYLKLELESMIPSTINKLKKYGWNPSDFTNNQILALTSYFFNRGYSNSKADAILNKKNSPTINDIGNNLPNYWGSASYAKKGLVNRRNKEKALFFSGSSGNKSNSGTTTNSKYTLTKAEFESICRYVMQETKGEKSDAEKAMAQVIYDRMTSGSGRFGSLSNILNNSEGFDTYYTGELNDTVENNVKAVFCENKKYWKNSIAYYFLTPDAPNVSYKARDNEYDRLGNVATHTYWGYKRKGSSIKYTIVEGDGTGAASNNNQSESTNVQHEAYTLDDIDRFGEPIIVKTEYTQKRGSGDHWRDTVNSTDNIFYTSFVNDYQYSARGRFVRAFPAYLFCILDDQAQWYDGKKLWTNYYTHKSVVDIAVHETNDMPTATATIVVNNSYHNLDRTQGGLSNYSIQNDKDYNGFVKWFHKYTGMLIGCGPKLTSTLIELHQVIYSHARLREDARVCLRMGYGSDPLSLAPVINGHISDVSLGNQISIVVTSDGHEFLQHVMDSNSEKDGKNNGFLGLFGLGAAQESSNIIGKVLCVRASWMHYLSSKWGEASKYSIEHFGLYNNQTLLSNFDYSNVSGKDIADMADAGYDFGEMVGADIPIWSDVTKGLGWLLGGAAGVVKEGADIVGDTVSGVGETISDIWNEYSEQYDILKNIYKADYKAETYHHNCGWIFDGEENVVFTDYNMTPWDVFQVCTQQVPEYIVKPSYHQFDSRLYFGLPFWMEKFRYDIINGSPHEECKASTQVHYLCSLTNIIDNQVRVTSKYSFTNIKVMYQRGSSAVTTQVIHSDDTIDYSRQKTRILDTPIVQDAFGPDLVYELLGYDIGDDSARRTGISNLLYGWQQQYQGELLCLGCPGIYAHDYLMLNDMFANMFGVCIVREVTHSFNTNTGFTTGIVPGMIGFSTDEQSGLIETTQNYLMMASLFASYSSQRRGLKNACEANMQLLADMEVARQKMDALCDYVNNWQTADTVYQISSTVGLGLLIYKTAKNMQTAFKVLKTTGEFVKFGKDLYKGAKAGVNVVKGLKTMFTAIEAGGAAAAPETLGVSLVVTVIMFMIDALLDEFFEWFSNKNVCTLLPLWWENYPFVSGVKDGEKILIMPSNSTATPENRREDATEVESNDD